MRLAKKLWPIKYIRRRRNPKALAHSMLADARPYHPLGKYAPARLKRPEAAFHERWNAVSSALVQFDAKNFCDLGCAEGYYVRRAAQELGVFAVGIDESPKRLGWATAVAVLDEVWSCGFLRMELDSKTLATLPSFDAVACMSLIHHIIYHQGMDEAEAMLRQISRLTRKCMIFDMGGPEEVENEWAESLSMLAGDVDKNIADMLEKCGFSNVTAIGSSSGYNTSAKRTIFTATPYRD